MLSTKVDIQLWLSGVGRTKKQEPRQLISSFFARDGSGKSELDAALKINSIN
jgi:hypothetical protein